MAGIRLIQGGRLNMEKLQQSGPKLTELEEFKKDQIEKIKFGDEPASDSP